MSSMLINYKKTTSPYFNFPTRISVTKENRVHFSSMPGVGVGCVNNEKVMYGFMPSLRSSYVYSRERGSLLSLSFRPSSTSLGKSLSHLPSMTLLLKYKHITFYHQAFQAIGCGYSLHWTSYLSLGRL